MKRRYLIIVIFAIAVIVIGKVSLPYFIKAKSRYEYSLFLENVNKAFEEMVAFCEENQKEIETYSNRYISSQHKDMSYEEIVKLENQIIEDMDCAWLFEKISVGYGEWETEEKIILYQYRHFNHVDYEGQDYARSIEIFYVEEISQQELEKMYFFDVPYFLCDIKKINNHLYVCVRGYMCL